MAWLWVTLGAARRVHRPQLRDPGRVPGRMARRPLRRDQAQDPRQLPLPRRKPRQAQHRRSAPSGGPTRPDHQALPRPRHHRAKRLRLHRDEPGKVWTPEQLRAFPLTADGHRLSAFFRLAAYTGARRGELLNLRWEDVDPDGASIHIRGSVGFVAGQRIEGTTKSGRSRIVSIDPGTVDVLKAHRKRQFADKLKAGEFWKGTDDGHVFATDGVSRCTRTRSRRLWRR